MSPQEEQLTRIEQKIEATHAAAEKTRKYMLTMLIVTLVTIVLPLILMAVALPMAVSSLGGLYGI